MEKVINEMRGGNATTNGTGLFGEEMAWFKSLSMWEKVKAVVSVLLTEVFLVMICCETAFMWWYVVALVVLVAAVLLVVDLPLDRLEE